MRDPTELHTIKRRDGESVGDFITRFSKESMQIKGADETLRISAFIHGVRNDQPVERFHENLPKTIEEMLERAKAFVRDKKACEQLREHTPKKSVQNTWEHMKAKNPSKPWNNPHSQSHFTPGNIPFQPRFNTFPETEKPQISLPPLAKTPSEILAT
jgi:hypothetical protein